MMVITRALQKPTGSISKRRTCDRASASDPDVSGALLERELTDGGDLCDILSRLSSWELIVHTLDDCRDQSGGGRRQRWYLQSVDGTQAPRLLRIRKRLKNKVFIQLEHNGRTPLVVQEAHQHHKTQG